MIREILLLLVVGSAWSAFPFFKRSLSSIEPSGYNYETKYFTQKVRSSVHGKISQGGAALARGVPLEISQGGAALARGVPLEIMSTDQLARLGWETKQTISKSSTGNYMKCTK